MSRNRLLKIKFPSGGYSLQLFLFTLLPITLIVLTIAIGSQNLHHEAMRSLVGDRNLRAVKSSIDNLEQDIHRRQLILQALAQEVTNNRNLNSLSLEPGQINELFDGGLILANSDGGLIDLISDRIDDPGDWSNRLRTLQPGGKPIPVIATLFDEDLLETVIVIAVPVGRDQLIGIVRAIPFIESNLGGFLVDSQGAVLVVSHDGAIGQSKIIYEIGQPTTIPEHLNHHPGVEQVLRGERGILYDHAHQKGELIIVYSPIQLFGWGVIVEEQWDEIASPILRNTQSAPLVMVPILLISVLALWYSAHSIVQPLNRLERQASQLARGDFEVVRKPVGGIREIQSLQAALVVMADNLKAARQSLHEYIGAMTAGIENERRNLARELHDDTIQALIALNQRIQLAAMRAPGSSKETFIEVQGLVQQAITNLRGLIRGLRPIYLEDLGLVTALQTLVQETKQNSGIEVQFEISGVQRRIPVDQEMMLYRMVQESLNNIIRHARVQTAEIMLEFNHHDLRLSIIDQGAGFEMPDHPIDLSRQGHFGLLGLQERAELIGAALEIHSVRGQGTRIRVTLPFSDNSTIH